MSKILLNELNVSNDDRIKDAINRVLRVRIVYNDKKPHIISKRRGYQTRYILPVAYGVLKNGKRAIRAYQTAGSSKRGVPKWKLFLLDNIISWSNGKKTFKDYKQALINLGLNLEGDKHMTSLYAITPFANQNVQVSKYDHEITPEPIEKDDVAPNINTQQLIKPSNKKEPVINTTQPHSIDNDKKIDYNVDIESPITEPISKTDISGIQNKNINTSTIEQPGVTTNIEPVSTEPVTKTEIETGESNIDNTNDIDLHDNDFVKKFNDLNNRMNNLYKDENN